MLLTYVTEAGTRHIPLSPAAVEMVASRFRVLGEPVRIRIIQELQGAKKSISDLVAAIGSTQPNVSKHVRILEEAGIVARRHEGTTVFCSITDEGVLGVCDAVCASIGERLARDAVLVAELTGRLPDPRG
jgi:DNA-binding transcriptional ArsR family regulator